MTLGNKSSDILLNQKPERSYVIWGLWLFLIAAVLGTSMRLFWVMELPFFEYTNVLHAHSHLAMLGWGFTIICTLFTYFLHGRLQKPIFYRWSLLANSIVCLVMTVAFILKGYTILSISLLTAHLLIAYFLGYLLLIDLKKLPNQTAALLGRWAIYWMFISTLGVWLLPIVIVNFGKLDPLYSASIEFFLHLQFNGWFVYAILAFLVLAYERKGILLEISKWEFWGLQISLILTYGLPAYWSYPLAILSYFNALGVAIQLVVLWRILIPMLKKSRESHYGKREIGDWLVLSGILSLLAKTAMQSTLLLPTFLLASSEIRHFFIGFIHLIMLGVFTMTSLGVCHQAGIVPQNNLSKLGFVMLIFGFISTELVLFVQGLLLWNSWGSMPNYHEIILAFTILLPIGIAVVIASFFWTFYKIAPKTLL